MQTTITAVGEPVALAECPPGFFLWQGEIGFKTQYGMMTGTEFGGNQVEWKITSRPDAYASDGSVFWGGATTPEERDALVVQPITLEYGVVSE